MGEERDREKMEKKREVVKRGENSLDKGGGKEMRIKKEEETSKMKKENQKREGEKRGEKMGWRKEREREEE